MLQYYITIKYEKIEIKVNNESKSKWNIISHCILIDSNWIKVNALLFLTPIDNEIIVRIAFFLEINPDNKSKLSNEIKIHQWNLYSNDVLRTFLKRAKDGTNVEHEEQLWQQMLSLWVEYQWRIQMIIKTELSYAWRKLFIMYSQIFNYDKIRCFYDYITKNNGSVIPNVWYYVT